MRGNKLSFQINLANKLYDVIEEGGGGFYILI